MDNLKIILFICNWGPHAAFQALQDRGADLPPEVRMIRIPCTGSMSKSLLFRAFELGADGVALVGCEPGSCRYGSGTDVAERNAEDTRGILDLLGLRGGLLIAKSPDGGETWGKPTELAGSTRTLVPCPAGPTTSPVAGRRL